MWFQNISIEEIAEVKYEDGIENAYRNAAIKMIKANKPDHEIHEMTELSFSDIQSLREQYA